MSNESQLIFDKNKFDRTFLGDEDIKIEIIKEFLQQVPVHINNLMAAYKESQLNQLELVSHTLKGLFATFCCENFRLQAMNIESMAKNSTLPDLREIKNLQDNALTLSKELKNSYISTKEIS